MRTSTPRPARSTTASRSRRSGMKYELHIQRRFRALLKLSQNRSRMLCSESEGELTTDNPHLPGHLSSGGKQRDQAKTSPVQYTQFSATADSLPATMAPVIRVMLSRHSWEFRTLPFHFFLTAAPPVN